MSEPKTEEEVFTDDLDPLEAISQLRKEGVTTPVEAPDEDEMQEDAVPVEDLDPPKEKEVAPEEDSFPEGEEGESEESDEEPKEKVATRKFRANGQEFEFTDQEIMEQFETVFGQAMDYTQKTQKIAPYRKMISALEEEGISSDDLNLAIDALKGNKDAFQKMMENNNIDPFDLPEEGTPYTPPQFGKNEQQMAIDDVVQRIGNDVEYSKTVDVVDKVWDTQSRQVMAQHPEYIEGLHNDIKQGVYDIVSPMAMKMKVLDGSRKSDIEYYMLAGQQHQQNSANNAEQTANLNNVTQAAESQFDQASSDATKRRSAATTRTRADRKGVIDYLDDDDEKFDDWYKDLMSKT